MSLSTDTSTIILKRLSEGGRGPPKRLRTGGVVPTRNLGNDAPTAKQPSNGQSPDDAHTTLQAGWAAKK